MSKLYEGDLGAVLKGEIEYEGNYIFGGVLLRCSLRLLDAR